jgi:GTP 3',8-cyclase
MSAKMPRELGFMCGDSTERRSAGKARPDSVPHFLRPGTMDCRAFVPGPHRYRSAGMRGELKDSHGRVMRDLRVSITDRCNFRCLYCLPETEEAANFYRGRYDALRNPRPAALTPIHREWKPKSHLLSYEEIERVVRIAAGLGVEKVRVTGGEPLLRRGVDQLVARLAAVPGIQDLALTTNGFLFGPQAVALRQAGLRRVSFSMDSLDPENFRRMTGRDGMHEVLAGIRQARELGFHPVKVNAVVIRELNDHEIEALAEFARRENLSLRFIEFMPLDSSRAWQKERVMSGREIIARLRARFDLVPVDPSANPSETSRRWAFADGRGEIGVIAPVSEPFCGHCNRLRLTADGQVRTCLFSLHEHDLKPLLRGGASDDELAARLIQIVAGKEAGHRIGQPDFVQPARTMSCIGG